MRRHANEFSTRTHRLHLQAARWTLDHCKAVDYLAVKELVYLVLEAITVVSGYRFRKTKRT